MTFSYDIPLMLGGEAQVAAIVAHQPRCAFFLGLEIFELLWVELPLEALGLIMVVAFDGALVFGFFFALLAYQLPGWSELLYKIL